MHRLRCVAERVPVVFFDEYKQLNLCGKRILSSLAVSRLCDTIGRYVYLLQRLTPLSARRFYRFAHIVPYSSGEVVGKVAIAWSNGCHYVIKPRYRQYGTTTLTG